MTEAFAAFAARCDLLGLEPLPLALLGVDTLLLAALVGGLVERWEREEAGERWGAVRTLLACGLLFVATVVLPATALGAAGWLSSPFLLAVHAALLLLLVVAERSRGVESGPRTVLRWMRRPFAALSVPVRTLLSADAWRRGRASESALLVALVGLIGFYLVVALFTPAYNYDANTYRLSRIALWLQEGRLWHFPTDDGRQNWVGHNADLVMLWLTGFFRREFPLVQLAQVGGGLLGCLAVHSLGAWLGWPRFWRLGAALVFVGMPTVGTQLASAQTDLFAAGCLAAGLALLPSALASGRRADWLLVGIGFGAVLGTKLTVLFLAPGLALLAAGWAWLTPGEWRKKLAGAAWGAVAALALSSFNLVLNFVDDGNPFAAQEAFDRSIAFSTPPRDVVQRNLLKMIWRSFEPHSNPALPAIAHEPAFAALLPPLAAHSWKLARYRDEVLAEGGWRAHGLSEDEASFGIVVPAAALVAGLFALGGAIIRRRPDRWRVVLIAVAAGSFPLLLSRLIGFGVSNFRFFCLIAPLVALLVADLLALRRSLPARALGGLLLVAQLATAASVAAENRNGGLRVLREPAEARWHRHWVETRQLSATLGDEPLSVGLALPGDSWQAPLFRNDVAHRWQPIPGIALRDRPQLAEVLAASGLDALVADPLLLRGVGVAGLSIRRAHTPRTGQRVVVRPLAAGARAGPRVHFEEGVQLDRWSEPRSVFWLSSWHAGRFELEARNATPLRREVVLGSARERQRFVLEPGATARLSIAVAEQDAVVLEVTPPFVPAEHVGGPDRRRLGLRLGAVDVARWQGLFADGWTAPRAELAVRDWLDGVVDLELENPTSLVRTLRARSSLDEAVHELLPGQSRIVTLAVDREDRVTLDISPPFVPNRHGAATDGRELGLLVAERRDER